MHTRLVVRPLIALFVLASGVVVTTQDTKSPAEQRIASAQKAIDANPKQAQPYADLALALTRRARETGDPTYYARADEALSKALAIQPDSFDARKIQAWVLLGKHEFARAREVAAVLNKQVPDDVLVYGFLADANAELGDYKAAEDAVQWMLDMRAGNLSGLTRAAYLRELFGDIDGALEAFSMAYSRMAPSEIEDRAWVLSQMGHLYLSSGKQTEAESALQQALMLFPKYHYALGYLAKVRVSQQRYQEAVSLLRELCSALPHAENIHALAQALDLAKSPEAPQTYAEFEKRALAESVSQDNANRELIAYYADYAKKPHEALRIAEIERSRRHDVYTLDAYAWALSQSGNHLQARKEMDQALAVGIKNAEFFYHSGVIASRLKNPEIATRDLTRSIEQSPYSPVAASARALLDGLKRAPTSKR